MFNEFIEFTEELKTNKTRTLILLIIFPIAMAALLHYVTGVQKSTCIKVGLILETFILPFGVFFLYFDILRDLVIHARDMNTLDGKTKSAMAYPYAMIIPILGTLYLLFLVIKHRGKDENAVQFHRLQAMIIGIILLCLNYVLVSLFNGIYVSLTWFLYMGIMILLSFVIYSRIKTGRDFRLPGLSGLSRS